MSLSDTYRTVSDVRFRTILGEAVVLRQDEGEMLVLNETGALLLDVLAGGATVEDAARRLAESFDVAPKDAERHTREFVTEMVTARVLEPKPDANAEDDGRR